MTNQNNASAHALANSSVANLGQADESGTSTGKFDLKQRVNYPLKPVAAFVEIIKTVSVPSLKAELLERMKSHICYLVDTGIIPKTVASYGDIDNFCDANDIGKLCNDEIFEALVDKFGGRDEHEGMPDGMFRLLRDVKDGVDKWIVGNDA